MYKHYEKFKRTRPRPGFSVGAALIPALCLGFLLGTLMPSKKAEPEGDKPLLPLTPVKSAAAETPVPALPAASASPYETVPPDPDEEGTVRLSSSVITVSIDGVPTVMELEEYLIGVVAAEMSSLSEPAALEAQAVAARTFTALHMQGRAKCGSGCTVCDDIMCCQAYITAADMKTAWGDKYKERFDKIRSAVMRTEGLVAVYEGRLISALYHASSGPATENSEEVFAVAQPYLVSVDSREGDAEMVSVQEFSVAEAVERINAAFPQVDMKIPLNEKDFEVWGRSDSGRVQLIRVGEGAVTGTALRMALGLKSTAFTVEFDDTTVRFTCLGYGHGVGMSQLGANEMAKQGADFIEILEHYYTGIDIARLTYG